MNKKIQIYLNSELLSILLLYFNGHIKKGIGITLKYVGTDILKVLSKYFLQWTVTTAALDKNENKK